MDLGAPVLAYKATAKVEAGPNAVFKPSEFSSDAYSQSNKNKANKFNPTVDIVTQSQVSYRNSTVQVDLVEEQTVVKQETVIIYSP